MGTEDSQQKMSGQSYQPELWPVEKDAIYAAIPALEAAYEHTESLLQEHDISLGRTTRKNKAWAKTLESDLRQISVAIQILKRQSPDGPKP